MSLLLIVTCKIINFVKLCNTAFLQLVSIKLNEPFAVNLKLYTAILLTKGNTESWNYVSNTFVLRD